MALTKESLAALVEEIASIVESSISESFIETVLKRLDSFGCTLNEDSFSIAFSIQKTEQTIKNECNTSSIPLGLICHAVDMACGEFLSVKHKSGNLKLEAMDLDGALESVKIGNASVSFDNNTSDEGKLNSLISILKNSGRGEFACYRQFKW